MREQLIRHVGPLVVVTLEVEGPTRVSFLASEAERVRLIEWIGSDEQRKAVVDAALAAVDGARVTAWSKELRREPGGIADAIGDLFRELERLRRVDRVQSL